MIKDGKYQKANTELHEKQTQLNKNRRAGGAPGVWLPVQTEALWRGPLRTEAPPQSTLLVGTRTCKESQMTYTDPLSHPALLLWCGTVHLSIHVGLKKL